MQLAAPDVVDISKEPKHILDSYGAVPGEASPQPTTSPLERRRPLLMAAACPPSGSLVHQVRRSS